MNRCRRVVAATLVLLGCAALLVAPPARAQDNGEFRAPPECSSPPPAPVQNGIRARVISPTGTDPRTSPSVPVEASFTNESRRPVVDQPNGQISQIRASVLACEPGLVVPTAPDPVEPPGDPQTASFAWSAEFPTNGRFAIVLEARGTSTNPEGTQFARVVTPVTLAVPPKKPTNVSVSDPVDGLVTVSWDYVDPEPDLFGFEVRRARQGTAEYTTTRNGAVGPKARSVTDAPPVGAWRYHVVAYRKGAPEGAISRDDTVEIAEPPPPAATSGSGTDPATPGTTSTGGSTRPGTGGDASSTTVAGDPGSASASRGTVDLSDFAATLNARRNAPRIRIEPPDPGFQETLPFDAPGQLEIEEAEPAELGADEPNVGLGQQPIADPGERERSLGFVAFGLLLFVLSMTGLFVKSEVKRADLRDLDPVDGNESATTTDQITAPVVAAAAATRSGSRRRRPRPVSADETDLATEAEEITPRRRRRAAVPAPVPVAAAVAVAVEQAPASLGSDASAIDIPETRRRWSGRVASSPAVEDRDGDYHDFADLATPPLLPEPASEDATAVAATPTRRRPRTPAQPLDAPGLDIPDPPATTRRRPASAKASLPRRTAGQPRRG